MATKKRVNIFKNGTCSGGKVVFACGDMDNFLNGVGDKLGIQAKKIFTEKGGEIDDMALIENNDVLHISEGEDFSPVCSNHLVNCIISKQSTAHPRIPVMTSCESNEWITINVGGKNFMTTRSTLTTKEPNSMLARMFSHQGDHTWSSSVDASGAYLVDRSPIYFEPILNYMRHGELVLDKHISLHGVLEEAKFFGISSLVDVLESKIKAEEPVSDLSPISRREFILQLMSTPHKWELRCQGVNFTGVNFSKLDLRNINFKYAVFRDANLAGANLSHCNFERADLAKAKLDGANLLGVKMLCAGLEAASMQGCNFEDPAGGRANMEGANMKFVNLEGSHMAGVNLRVATLKNANLQNCDLRGAVLAGADLENCNLSGCDLQEANLRGANVKGAAFELMLNPLHMSQTIR